jgi:uncharacterized protein (TIGR02118 family)
MKGEAIMSGNDISSGLGRRVALVLGLGAGAALVMGTMPGAAAATKAKGVKLTVLYGTPKDPAAFETYYAGTHMPMVYKVKGIKHIELAKGLPGPDGKPPAYYRVTELWFSSMKQMQTVTATPAFQKVVADVPNFASGGATIVTGQIE